MKKLFTLLLFTIVFAYGHAQWTQISSGTTEDLYNVHFANQNIGYAVGDNGTVIKTNDGGATWNNCFGFEERLFMVYVIDEQNVFVGGTSTYHSTDGGITWEDLGFGAPKEIKFVDEMTGYLVVYNGIKVTTDGGATWEELFSAAPSDFLAQIFINNSFSINNTITTFGDVSGMQTNTARGYRNTSDGDWVILDNASLPNEYEHTSAAFPDADSGYLFNNQNVGWLPSDNSQMVKMTNFELGTDPNGFPIWSFTSETINDDIPGYVNDNLFLNMTKGWIITIEGGIYLTESGGETWIPEYEGEVVLKRMACLNNEPAFVVGEGGLILKKGSTSTNNDIVSQDEISVTPTFVSKSATVTGLSQNDEVRVYNMAGALVYQKDVRNNELTIHTSGWNKGLYIVRVSSNGYAKKEKKFVVK